MIKIYLAHNMANGKVYVGKTSRTVIARWNEHIKKASTECNWSICNAIRKHGPDIFKVREIDSAETEQLANEREQYWIKLFQSYRPENGYNLTLGGEGIIPNNETRQKMSVAHMGEKATRYRHDIRTEDVINLYVVQNLCLREIAETYGCSKTTIKHRLLASGVILRPIHNDIRNYDNKNFLGHHHSLETKIKISHTKKENPTRYWLGKSFSPEHCHNISIAKKKAE